LAKWRRHWWVQNSSEIMILWMELWVCSV
jgi:hypothetical protein